VTASHPDPSLLERFLRGELAADERKSVVRHLIGGCVTCRELAGDLWLAAPNPGASPNAQKEPESKPEHRRGPVASADPSDYRTAMDRAIRIARERRQTLAAARQKTPELLAELLAVPAAERLALAQWEPRFASPPLCEELLARRAAATARSPSGIPGTPGTSGAPGKPQPLPVEPRELADLALVLAERLDGSLWGASIVRDLEARAWAHRGDVAREAGLAEDAQRAFRMAHSLYALSSQDPWDWAEISRYEARFELSRGQAAAATALGLESAALYRKLGERDLLVATLAEVGPMATRAGRLDLAIETLAEAVELIDPAREPRRLACCLHWLGALLLQTERARESLGHLWRARSLYERLGEEDEILRVRWIEARAALAVGSLAEGEAALLAVRGHLLAAGLGQDAAGVLLDLVQLYWDQGRRREIRNLFGEIFLPYRTRDLSSGAIAAVLMLRRAVETESATIEMVREVASYLAASRPICRPG
jgi:tetratricopeptide (TPR) repeat protein